MTKKKTGCPSQYKPEFAQKMIEYFDRPLFQIQKKETMEYGKKVVVKEIVCNEPPFFGSFARHLGFTHQCLIKWKNDETKPEFVSAYKECKNIQEEWIAKNMLMGKINPRAAMFALKNVAKWRDQVEPKQQDDSKGVVQLAYSVDKSIA